MRVIAPALVLAFIGAMSLASPGAAVAQRNDDVQVPVTGIGTAVPIGAAGQPVTFEGTLAVRRFERGAIARELGVDLQDGAFERWEGKPVIIAASSRVVRGQEQPYPPAARPRVSGHL